MKIICKLIIKTLNQIILILFTILIVISSCPIFLLIFCPIYLFRFAVKLFSKFFRPDLIRIVETRSAPWALDDIHKNPDCNLIVACVFNGKFSVESFIEISNDRIIEKKCGQGKYLYPELRQYYENWLGFPFWKYEDNFNLSEHIQFIPAHEKTINDSELFKYIISITHDPWPRFKSPWKIIVIPKYSNSNSKNDNEEKSSIIFVFSHGMCDGFSLLNLVNEFGDFDFGISGKPSSSKKSLISLIWNSLTFPLKAPYDIVKQFWNCYDSNDLKIKSKNANKIGMFGARTPLIPIESIKSIKNSLNVSFTSVLLETISGGVRKLMETKKMEIPNNIHLITPFPIPGHPRKMRNHYSFVNVKLPIGEKNPRKRLKLIEENFSSLKSSNLPKLNFISIPIISLLFAPMVKFFTRNWFTTGILSNFPGPEKQLYLNGLHVEEIHASAGALPGSAGLGFLTISYGGFVRITVGLSKCIESSTQADAEHLAKLIMEEFLTLENYSTIV